MRGSEDAAAPVSSSAYAEHGRRKPGIRRPRTREIYAWPSWEINRPIADAKRSSCTGAFLPQLGTNFGNPRHGWNQKQHARTPPKGARSSARSRIGGCHPAR